MLKTKNDPNARNIINLLEDPEQLLSTIRAAKYSMALAVVLLAYYAVWQMIPPEMEDRLLAFVITTLLLVILLLVFGEVLPRVYARQNNLRMSIFASPIIMALKSLFIFPGKMLVDHNFYGDNQDAERQRNENDDANLEKTLELSMGHAVSKDEIDIFKGIMKFGKITVKQIMQPRLDVIAIRDNWDFERVRNKVISSGYSRIPVYHNNFDDITGMIYTKDLLPYTDLDDFEWHTLIRPAYFVHQQKLIDDLLQEFRTKKQHFAVVVDEFGGTSGIITLEDIIEEIIGDIKDEYDEEDANYVKLDDKNFIFTGRTPINDMCRIMNIPLSSFNAVRGQSDSVAGLLLEIYGRFPALNEKIVYSSFQFIILSLDNLRIEKVKVTRL